MATAVHLEKPKGFKVISPGYYDFDLRELESEVKKNPDKMNDYNLNRVPRALLLRELIAQSKEIIWQPLYDAVRLSGAAPLPNEVFFFNKRQAEQIVDPVTGLPTVQFSSTNMQRAGLQENGVFVVILGVYFIIDPRFGVAPLAAAPGPNVLQLNDDDYLMEDVRALQGSVGGTGAFLQNQYSEQETYVTLPFRYWSFKPCSPRNWTLVSSEWKPGWETPLLVGPNIVNKWKMTLPLGSAVTLPSGNDLVVTMVQNGIKFRPVQGRSDVNLVWKQLQLETGLNMGSERQAA